MTSVLFLGKKNDPCTAFAANFCQRNFETAVHLGGWGEALPEDIALWRGDYIISYLSRWVVPDDLLKRVVKAAINFHPASSDYPGIGCVNFALYDEAKEYGVTCHHMAPKVDTGEIIATKRFSVLESDNVESLLDRTYAHQLALFYEILTLVVQGKDLPVSAERWTRKPFTRREFEDLTKIRQGMNDEEVRKRVRAVTFKEFGPVYLNSISYSFPSTTLIGETTTT